MGAEGASGRPRPLAPATPAPAQHSPLRSLASMPSLGPPSSSGLPVASAPVVSQTRLPFRVRMTGDLEGQDRGHRSIGTPSPISLWGRRPTPPGTCRWPHQALVETWGSKS